MRRAALSTIAILLLATPGPAAESRLKKAYFTATPPGSFARYRMVDDKGAITETVSARLADQGGDRWIEMRHQVLAGEYKGPGSVMSYLIAASFPFESGGLDVLGGARRAVAQVGKDAPAELPADTVKAIATNRMDYASMVVWKGAETLDGRATDHYAYVYKTNYANIPATMTGDLWLSDAVPFAIVRESAVIKDAKGKLLGSYDTKLAESGTGAQTALVDWRWGGAGNARQQPATAAPPDETSALRATASSGSPATSDSARPLTLADAYREELVSIACLVSSGSGGARLRLTITNQSDHPIEVLLTRAPMRFEAGTPIGTLTLAASGDQKLAIPAGEDADPIEINQIGRRVTAGRFTLSRYEGTPLFQGSAEVGPSR